MAGKASRNDRSAFRGELKRLQECLGMANLVIEVRDARAPLTTSLEGIIHLGSKKNSSC